MGLSPIISLDTSCPKKFTFFILIQPFQLLYIMWFVHLFYIAMESIGKQICNKFQQICYKISFHLVKITAIKSVRGDCLFRVVFYVIRWRYSCMLTEVVVESAYTLEPTFQCGLNNTCTCGEKQFGVVDA